MANSFLFIIPLTPKKALTSHRLFLRKLCFESLTKQTYNNWKAIIIGESSSEIEIESRDFIKLNYEGQKEEKLQFATKYYFENKLDFDYILRLDDDDVFNPKLLKSLSDSKFDVFTDKYHSFVNSGSGQISQLIKYWFPNTCIISSKHALCNFGSFPPGDYQRYRASPYLIENEHNDFHKYFNQNHVILFSKKNNPVYLRVLSPNSITSKSDLNYLGYLNQFGNWQKNHFVNFYFLNNVFENGDKNARVKQSIITKLIFFKRNLTSTINYYKLVILKNT